MSSRFGESEIDEIREAFNLFDTDGSGTIDLTELKTAMESLGLSVRNHSMYKIVSDIEAEGKGSSSSINFDEFVAMLTSNLVRYIHHEYSWLIYVWSTYEILYSWLISYNTIIIGSSR